VDRIVVEDAQHLRHFASLLPLGSIQRRDRMPRTRRKKGPRAGLSIVADWSSRQSSPASLHFLKIVLNCPSAALAASFADTCPCATWAAICGIRKLSKISPTAAFENPGWPAFVVYFSAIAARTV